MDKYRGTCPLNTFILNKTCCEWVAASSFTARWLLDLGLSEEFDWSPMHAWVFLKYSSFLQQTKYRLIHLQYDSKLYLSVSLKVNGCLSPCQPCDWRMTGARWTPTSHSTTAGTGFSSPWPWEGRSSVYTGWICSRWSCGRLTVLSVMAYQYIHSFIVESKIKRQASNIMFLLLLSTSKQSFSSSAF